MGGDGLRITDELVERCARAAWIAGRCSPPWESAAGAMTETYRRSTRAVLETAFALLPRDRDPSGCGELLREAGGLGTVLLYTIRGVWRAVIDDSIMLTDGTVVKERSWAEEADSPEAALRAALDRAKGAGDAQSHA